MTDFTVVLGVDKKHLEQLRLVWPTWKKYKPSLLKQPFVIFYDSPDILDDILGIVQDIDVRFIYWEGNPNGYPGNPSDKWTNPQRYKMLAGFVHVPAQHVNTEYWLKIDLDTLACDMDDWIDSSWFNDQPAIISHPWGYTKPADQMVKLDRWVEKNQAMLPVAVTISTPLRLIPKEGANAVGHERIISWCAFFNTRFSIMCSAIAEKICGPGLLPVPSQDGYHWYMAKRGSFGILRTNMKRRGWKHLSSTKHILREVWRETA